MGLVAGGSVGARGALEDYAITWTERLYVRAIPAGASTHTRGALIAA